ncbi:hypothetical protein [Actinomycetospora termitidis]|uniref:Integral membrane protein n=1 Tax=Actinomycetospora termitidis TaxID=3053470 RepID=A0ABT7M5A4_9PSEU|nr:hypothetical protein [Actinomycetospora sp. Odt1-22]MDL5155841.1 hypothetical protein [Actinomycetospora sp. Odt1-22]
MTTVPDAAPTLRGPRRARHHACLEAGGAHYLASPDARGELCPTGLDGLRRGLDLAASARARAPFVGAGALVAVAVATVLVGPSVADLPSPLPVLTLLVGLVATGVVLAVTALHDRARRTVVATHEMADRDRTARYEHLVATWERLRCAATSWEPAVWEVRAEAGRRAHSPVARRTDGPRHLRADLPVPTFSGARREIAFLPDRVVLRDGRFHTVVGYDTLEVDASTRARAEGGRLGRLTLRAAGIVTVLDLASVDAASATAAALRGMTDAHHRRARAHRGTVPAPRQPSDATGRSWASPTVAL